MCVRSQVIISCIGLAVIAALVGQIESTEYPTPPPVPTQFLTPNDVQKYLNQLHNYYMVVGRPRFGKRSWARVGLPNSAEDEPYISSMFNFLDLNGDHAISLAEFKRIFNKESVAE